MNQVHITLKEARGILCCLDFITLVWLQIRTSSIMLHLICAVPVYSLTKTPKEKEVSRLIQRQPPPPADACVLPVTAVRRQCWVGLVGEEQRTMKPQCHCFGSMARQSQDEVVWPAPKRWHWPIRRCWPGSRHQFAQLDRGRGPGLTWASSSFTPEELLLMFPANCGLLGLPVLFLRGRRVWLLKKKKKEVAISCQMMS